HTPALQLLDALAGTLVQLLDRAELDRRRWARLGAGWDQTIALAVVAERTLVRMAVEAGAGDDAKGAGGQAGRAAVADVGLNVDVLEFVVDDGAGWAGLLAGSRDTVLADVTHHQPAVCARLAGHDLQGDSPTRLALRAELLDKLDVPPGSGRQRCGV